MAGAAQCGLSPLSCPSSRISSKSDECVPGGHWPTSASGQSNSGSGISSNTKTKDINMGPSSLTGLALPLMMVSSTVALQCFQCSNCGDSAGTPYECSSVYDVCMKIDVAGHIEKTCGKKEVCSFGNIERGIFSAWNNLKSMISDVDQDLTFSDDTEAQVIKCCENDYCNSAMLKMVNPLVLILPILMYLSQY